MSFARVAISGSKFRRTHNHILLSHLRLPQPGGTVPCIYIPRNRVAQLYPRALHFIFFASYDSQDYCGSTGKSNPKLYYDQRSIGQSVFVSGTYLGPETNFLLLSLIIFRQLRVCWCGAPSPTRSRVCSFQFLLGIASKAFPRSVSQATHEYILLSLFLRLPQPGRPSFCINFLQEHGSPVIPSGIGFV
jgi:hypothetical protein